MSITLPISEMSTEDKLRAMDELWASLTEPSLSYSPPEWHQEALRETEKRIESGEETFVDWQEAKESLRRRAK